MGHVYLIGEKGSTNKYKIGSTRAKDVKNRLKQLQTGSSEELYIKDSYETEHPFKLEKMLHNHFKSSNLIGEWFELSESDIEAFRVVCEEKEKIISCLKDNPFYFNARIIPMKMNFDKPDRYGRVYDQETMKTLIEDFNAKLKEFGNIIGELNHPLQ